MGERICIMNDGEVVQVGAPHGGLPQSGRHLRRRLSGQPADEPARRPARAGAGGRPRGRPRRHRAAGCPTTQAALVHRQAGQAGDRRAAARGLPSRAGAGRSRSMSMRSRPRRWGPRSSWSASLGDPGGPEIIDTLPPRFHRRARRQDKLSIIDRREIHLFDATTGRALPRPPRRN